MKNNKVDVLRGAGGRKTLYLRWRRTRNIYFPRPVFRGLCFKATPHPPTRSNQEINDDTALVLFVYVGRSGSVAGVRVICPEEVLCVLYTVFVYAVYTYILCIIQYGRN